MLAEGRSAGLEAVFAWQYSAQIRDEVIRSGVRSLLQSISIFRMREMEDARSLAGLAMEVYSDRISVDQEEQERLRFSPDDVVKLPDPPRDQPLGRRRRPARRIPRRTRCRWRTSRRRRSPSSTWPPSASAAAITPGSCTDPIGPSTTTTTATAESGQPRAPNRSRAKRAEACRASAGAQRDTAAADPTSRARSPTSTDGFRAATPSSLRYDGAAVATRRRERVVPCAIQPRDLAVIRDVWRYKFLTATQLLELHWPGCVPGGRPTAAHQALRRRPPRPLPPDHAHRRLVPVDLPTRHGRTPPAARDRRCSTPAPASSTGKVYDYRYVLHEVHLNAWVLAWRRTARSTPARRGTARARSSRPPSVAQAATAPRRRPQRRGPTRRPRLASFAPTPCWRSSDADRRHHAPSSSSTTAHAASTRTSRSSSATTPACAGGGDTPTSRATDTAAVRRLRLPGRAPARRPSSTPPTGSSRATSGTQATDSRGHEYAGATSTAVRHRSRHPHRPLRRLAGPAFPPGHPARGSDGRIRGVRLPTQASPANDAVAANRAVTADHPAAHR